MINRVLDVMARLGTNSPPIETKEDEEKFNKAMGSFNEAYGYKNFPLLAAMWTASDLQTDWGAEADGLSEQYPILDAAYNRMPLHDKWTDETKQTAEAAHYEAEAIAIEFENKLFLACNVANAINALEGGIASAWDKLAFINLEFKNDRDLVRARINAILAEQRPFKSLSFSE